jgi:hypothetical protein
MRKILLSFILITFSCAKEKSTELKLIDQALEKEPLTINAEVDNANPTNIDTIKYTITFSYKKGITFEPPQIGQAISGFRIVDDGKEGPKTVGDREEMKIWYDLEPDVAGTYILPGIGIKFREAEEDKLISTNPIYINVGVSEAKTGETLIEDEALSEIPDDRYWFYSLISVASALLIGAIIFILKKISERKKNAPPPPAHVIALKELQELEKEGFASKGEARKYYFKLSDILRKYTDERFKLSTLESTQEEIRQMLKKANELDETHRNDIISFVERSDLVKFAKKAADQNEMKSDFDMTRQYIEKTKPIEEEKAKHV